MSYSRLVTAFSIAIIMLVMALAPIGLPSPTAVDAGHDGPTTSHLIRGHGAVDGRIVRNVILGKPIPVCSDAFPESAKAAAEQWNTFFQRTMFGKQVFQLKSGRSVYTIMDAACTREQVDPRLGIDSVLILQDPGKLCPDEACIYRGLTRPNDAWDTIIGQPVMFVKASPAGDSDDDEEGLSDGDARVTYLITHELGHVFGLANYLSAYCGAAPAGAYQSNYTTVPTVMGPIPRPGGTLGGCSSETPTDQDKRDFRLSYVPSGPTILEGESSSPRANEALIAWDAFRVHVENGFEIQRKRADGTWETVGTHEALPLPRPRFTLPLPELDEVRQRARVTLRGQPLGLQRYRVVALTRAPLQDDVAASGEIRVIVKGPPPLAPTGLTASGVVMGINLSWDLATDDPPINGYQYRLDSGEWQDIPSSNASTITYQSAWHVGCWDHVRRGAPGGPCACPKCSE